MLPQRLQQFLLVLWLLPLQVYAQECDWLEVGGGPGVEISTSTITDLNNNTLVCGSFNEPFSITNASQTYNFTNNLPRTGNTGGLAPFIIKYNEAGNILWTAQATRTAINGSAMFLEMAVDVNNDIYAVVECFSSLDFGNGVTTSNGTSLQFYFVLIKYSSSGVAQWARTLKANPSLPSIGTIRGNSLAVINNTEIVIGFTYGDTVTLSNTSQKLISNGNQREVGLVKYSTSGAYISSNSFFLGADVTLRNIAADDTNHLYAYAYSGSTFTLGGQTFPDTGMVILKMDDTFSFINGFKYGGRFTISYRLAVGADGKCLVSGLYRDSVTIGNVGLGVTVAGMPNTTFGVTNTFVAYLDTGFNVIWAKKGEPTVAGPSNIGSVAPNGGAAIRNGFIYFGGGHQRTDWLWDGTLTMKHTSTGFNLFVVKMDTLGNFLWAFSGGVSGSGSGVRRMETDLDGNAVITGFFVNTVNVFNRSATGPVNTNFFTAKIIDFSITRGNVDPGPYCAGDSFDIPFTKFGRYDTGNVFIAQLSDSAGNFDGGELELGRVVDTTGGTIKGVLPLFNVATSANYRIRIVSTKPIVQSFFRRDTLRLLVFSKDTANAGPDFWACRGAPVNLQTTGGSAWRWSPPTYMDNPADTSTRSPVVRPDSTIEYRIIISDSSGCGVTDTDFVKVWVRDSITAGIAGTSPSCRGQQITLRALATGGDSTYWYQWTELDSNTVLSHEDTLTVSPLNTITYQLVVGDNCTPRSDTAFFTLQIDTILTVTTTPDTTICKGNPANLNAWGSGCDTNQYVFTWVAASDTAMVLSVLSSFNPAPDSTTLYRVVLQDISTQLSDTAFTTVIVDDAFIASVTPDTTICQGQSIALVAQANSCDTSQLQYVWSHNLDSSQTNIVSPLITTTYQVVMTNLFNGLQDSAEVTVTVRDSLQLSLSLDTTICVGGQATLSAIPSGGRASTYAVQWTDDQQQIMANGLMAQVSPLITTTYQARLSDGCSVANDSGQVTVTLKDSLEILLPFTDTTICSGTALAFSALATGGDSTQYRYQWLLPDASTINQAAFNSIPPSSGTYRLTLRDSCSNDADTAFVTVTVRTPVTAQIAGPMNACYQENIGLSSISTGGDSSQYQYTWVLPDGNQATGSGVNLVIDSTSTYQLVVDDNCSVPSVDTTQVTITVPTPIVTTASQDTSLCLGSLLPLSVSISGGIPADYQIRWSGAGVQVNDTSATILVNSIDTGRYTFIVEVSDNCALNDRDTVIADVLAIPQAAFALDPITGCPPLQINTTDLSTSHDATLNQWRITKAGAVVDAQNEVSPAFTLNQSGRYEVFLKVSNAIGCTDSITEADAIELLDNPVADFTAVPEDRAINETITFLNQSSNATNFSWNFGAGDSQEMNTNNPVETIYTDSGTYVVQLIARNDVGCADTLQKAIGIANPFTYFIPNAFSPTSSSGLNDVFGPVITGTQSFSMKIFNRWGEIIYDCSEDCGWDGQFQGKQVPAGTYGYIIVFTSLRGERAKAKGVVTVMP